MIFESHAHYDDKRFDPDREALLASLPGQGIGCVINIGSDLAACKKTIALTEQYEFVYGAIGIHPSDIGDLNEEAYEWLKENSKLPKMVAIGEIGLDYYWEKESHEIQKKWFIRQLELAGGLGLPVVIHSREAAADTMEIMKRYAKGLKGVIHCYSYSREMAKEYVKMGFYIGVGGVVTFKNARKLKETVEEIPLASIVLETDCPYLAPVPYRGKRNHSAYIRYVAEEVARLKGLSCEEVIRQTEKNAKELYGFSAE